MIKNLITATLLTISIGNTYNYHTPFQIDKTLNTIESEQYYLNQNFAYNSFIGGNQTIFTGGGQYRGKMMTSITITPNQNTSTINVRTMIVEYFNNYQGTTNYIENFLYTSIDQINNWNYNNFDYIEYGYDRGSTNGEGGHVYVEEIYNLAIANKTNYTDIYNQISAIHNKITETTNWEYGGLYNLTKGVESIDTWQQQMNLIYGQNYHDYTNVEYEYEQEEATLNEYMRMTYLEISATRENLDDTSRTAYANTFRNLRKTVNLNGTYEAQPVINEITYEVIDIPGLMFTILGMPFAWISTAYNFTLFPGTPYAINISHLFMGIIVVLVLIFVIKKVIK